MYWKKTVQKNKYPFHLLSALLCIALLLNGCTLSGISPSQTRPPLQEQEAFNDFLDVLFTTEMSQNDSFSIHFSMEDPENYDVSVPEPTWGEPPSVHTETMTDELSAAQGALEEFHYDSLTTEQQITYDTLLISLETTLNSYQFTDFSQLFSPMKGMQTQIPLLFSEYDFYSLQDVEDYLSLMEQSYDFISDCLDYERTLAEKGYCLTDYSFKEVRRQCQEFLAPSENCLIPVFNEKIEALDFLEESQIADYKNRHQAALETYLIPAYQMMITDLEELEGKRLENGGLSHYKDGKKFYEYLVRSYTGSDKSVKELISATEKKMTADIKTLATLLSENPELEDEFYDYQSPYNEPSDILTHLKESCAQDFPAVSLEQYTIKDVPKSLEALSSPAFYLISPIDHLEKQVIYINNNENYASMDLFPTLAHEGFPGHMYAGYFYNSQNPHPIRSLLGPTGYHEGWAQYAENYAYQYSGLDAALTDSLTLNNIYSYALYARLDLGIHYQGWNMSQVERYLDQQGMDTTQAESLYYTLIDDPAVYLPYYISYLEILELKEEAQKKLKDDFSAKDFHDFFLSVGPTYFDVIEKHMKTEFLK